MELRDFFTAQEIREMKERIIKETCLSTFLVEHEVEEEYGTHKYRSVAPAIENVIREETVLQVKEYVREVVNKVAKERVAEAVDRFSENLCKQLDKITEKTNWHWSIK